MTEQTNRPETEIESFAYVSNVRTETKEDLFELCKSYYKQRQRIEQAEPVKDWEECLNEVALTCSDQIRKFRSWDDFIMWHKKDDAIVSQLLKKAARLYSNERNRDFKRRAIRLIEEKEEVIKKQAAELYASQFRNPVVVTDEEIESDARFYIQKHWDCEYETTVDGIRAQNDLEEHCAGFAKWMREKRNRKQK